jgi:energy-coupling factor transporter transmembrane protein EcfT
MKYVQRVKNLVYLAFYLIIIVSFVPKELREYALIAAIVFILLLVLLLILVSEQYRKILILVSWVIVGTTMIVLVIYLYQQSRVEQAVELEQGY